MRCKDYDSAMCLAVPMKVTFIDDDRATCVIGDMEREVRLSLLPEVHIGEYVIVHAGYAIQILNEQEAQETLQLFADLQRDIGETG